MADYSSIKGKRVQYLSTDPTLDSNSEGQVWYNTSTGTLKGLVHIKATSSGGNTPTNLYYPGGVGPTTATLAISGVGPSPIPAHTLCSDYSGYAWTAAATIPVGSRAGYDFGTATAAVYAGGDYQSPGASPTITLRTSEYDGSTWTNTNNINGQGSFGASAGTSTAGLAFGGYNEPQSASSTVTTSYDGSSWTSLSSPASDTNTARNFTRGGGGTQTAAIFSGGGPPNAGETESWDGSSWTSLNNMNTGRNGSGFNGTQTLGVYIGGTNPGGRSSAIEEWDGTSWTTSSGSLSTARNGTANSKGGSLTNSLVAGGYTGTAYTTATEEYFSDIANYNPSSGAAWSSGANYPTNVQGSGSDGTQTAAYSVGGSAPGTIPGTKLYDGTSWTDDANSLNTIRSFMGSCGTQTAGFVFGGDPYTNAAEQWDGSTWTSSSPYDSPKGYLGACGTQTAALGFGGVTGPPTTRLNTSESWDGSSWTAAPNLTTAKQGPGGFGTQTAAVAFGGLVSYPPTTLTNTTDEYNGSSWSSGGTYPVSLSDTSGTGTQTAGLGFGGYITSPPYRLSSANFYNGTAWTATSSLSEGKFYVGKAGGPTGQTYGLAIGGSNPTGATNSVEEFSLGSPASPTGAAASTLSSS